MVQIILNILIAFCIYTLISLSFSLIYYPARFFHIAHAVILTFSAYFAWFFSKQLHLPVLLAVLLAVLCATAIGMLSEIALFKPLRKRNASPMVLLIASLGIYIVLQNVISLIWGDNIKVLQTGEIRTGNHFMGAYITNIQVTTIVVSLVLFVTCIFFIYRSHIGRNIRSVASNPGLSNIVGINPDSTILWAFGIGSSLIAIAGILIAYDTGMEPTMGFNWLLYGVIAMIIGGVGSNWGIIGGALLIATAQNLGAYYIDSQWMNAIAYLILILFLIWKPLGFSGKKLKKVEI